MKTVDVFSDAAGNEVDASAAVRLDRYTYTDEGVLVRHEWFHAEPARDDTAQ